MGRRDFMRYGAGAAGLVFAASTFPRGTAGARNLHPRDKRHVSLTKASRTGTLRVGTGVQTPNLDALQSDDDTYAYAVFDALTSITHRSHKVVGNLAHKWKQISPTVTEFKLRPGVKFSNGTPLTASDVAFSFHTITEKGYQIASIITTIAKVEAVDPGTVRITTSSPDPILTKRVALIFIVPEQYYIASGSGFSSKPIGSGYYTISSFTPNSQIGFVASSNSWKGAPKTASIDMTQYSTQSALLSAMESGQLDIAQDLPPEAVQLLKGSDDLTDVNIGSPLEVTLQTLHGPFKDVRVREAANLAINVPELVQKVLGGSGAPLEGQLPGPGCNGYNPSVKAFGYDPKKAKHLLSAAGHANGFSTEIAGLSIDKDILEGVSGYLANVGIQAKVLPLEFDVWLKGFTNGSTWPMFLVGVNYSPLYDASLSYRYVTGTGIPNWNRNFASSEFDKLNARQSTELNAAKRDAILKHMAVLLHKEIPSIFLYGQEWIYAWKKSVTGVKEAAHFHLQLNELGQR